VPGGREPVVNVTTFTAMVVDEDDDEDDELVEAAPVAVVDVETDDFCCGCGQILICGLALENCLTESGSALNGGRIHRMFAFVGKGKGCAAMTAGAADTGTRLGDFDAAIASLSDGMKSPFFLFLLDVESENRPSLKFI
jgi:hypothetical protein